MSSTTIQKKHQLDKLVEEYQALQESIKDTQISRQRLTVQQNENEAVQQELNLLEPDAELYKLVGPVLVKQETAEASSTVQKRLEYIKEELERADKIISESSKKVEDKAQTLEAIQKEFIATMQKEQKRQSATVQ